MGADDANLESPLPLTRSLLDPAGAALAASCLPPSSAAGRSSAATMRARYLRRSRENFMAKRLSRTIRALLVCLVTNPSGATDAETSSLAPFTDTKFFQFAYGGDPGQGERIMAFPPASSTKDRGKAVRGSDHLFGATSRRVVAGSVMGQWDDMKAHGT
jgi:hypothetical protein